MPDKPKPKRSHRLPKIISREDARALLRVPNPRYPTGLRNLVALHLMYQSGLRESEVCNLAPEDVDLDRGFVFVQLGKGAKDRVVPLHQETIDLCQKWLKRRPESEWFLPTLKGGRMSERQVRAMVARMSKRAGVYLRDGREKKLVHPHTLRHCFATELLEDGVLLHEVQHFLGHESIRSTEVYLHVRPSEALAAKLRNRPGVCR